ncbi:MAG: D-alanyl-D-alanine carboxypeptidase [Rhodospirillales bacterium]
MNKCKSVFAFLVLIGVFGFVNKSESSTLAPEIKAIFDKPLYQNSIWGLRVVDLDTGEVLLNLRPNYDFFIGSVRKVFSVGELMNEVGAEHTSVTPVYRQGTIGKGGVLRGNLILVASGDLTMGGRTKRDGSIAVSNLDHNEANSLGNAVLTAPNPLAGYINLAQQVAAAGIKRIKGDVIIDDRLWVPFDFRGQFDVRPIFVNDDCVDLLINPGESKEENKQTLASVDWRPISAALNVQSSLRMSKQGTQALIELDPELPQCIGAPGCTAEVNGQLPGDFRPPLTNAFPVVRTFRIVEPADYARTVLIEALEAAGVKVEAETVAENPAHLLPPKNSYKSRTKVAELVSATNAEHAKFVLKISYNIGADSSLLLYGLTQGVDNMTDALAVEREALTTGYGIPGDEFFFVDGSGGGLTTAKNRAVTKWLQLMTKQRDFQSFFDALPILGVDGSLAMVTDFQSDPTLAGATGRVRAKTGTFAEQTDEQFLLRGQAFAGYIDARSGRRLVYQLAVGEVVINDIDDVLAVFQDEGKISAILWRDF